jgi:hypothetical protein
VSPQTAPMLSALVPAEPGTRLTVEQTVLAIHEEVLIRPQQPPATSTHLGIENWGWHDLCEYVVGQIEKIHGPTPRQPTYKEKAIFDGFLHRHGDYAVAIAKYAFEVAGGYWKNAPISVNRFTVNSDPYFANPIRTHLEQVARV